MFNLFFTTETQGCLSVIESVTAYKLASSDRQPFLYFHDYVTNPQPDFISNWRLDPQQEKWYQKFVNGILGMYKIL